MQQLEVNSSQTNYVLERWLKAEPYSLDSHLSSVQRDFRHYKSNIYLLNEMALKIQHVFFTRRASKVNDLPQKAHPRTPEQKKRKINIAWTDSHDSGSSHERSSSASGFEVPGAPIKKSQNRTLGRHNFLQVNDAKRYRGNHDDDKNRRARGTPSSFGSRKDLPFNFSNELESFNNSLIEETDILHPERDQLPFSETDESEADHMRRYQQVRQIQSSPLDFAEDHLLIRGTPSSLKSPSLKINNYENSKKEMQKQPKGRLQLQTTRAKPRFSRLHKMIQENFGRKRSSLQHNDDEGVAASSEYSSIIEFDLDGPGSGEKLQLRANTLDSHSSSSSQINFNETEERSTLDFLGSIVFESKCGNLQQEKPAERGVDNLDKRQLVDCRLQSMPVRRRSRLSKRPVEFYDYNDMDERTAGSTMQASAEKATEMKRVLSAQIDVLLIDDDSDVEDEYVESKSDGKEDSHGFGPYGGKLRVPAGVTSIGQNWSRNVTADSKPNLTMINEDICETEQSSSVASNAKGSHLYTFNSVTKKISADLSFDPMTSCCELTTGSSRRNARLYKRINGLQAYRTSGESDPVSKTISNKLSDGSEGESSTNSYANMISSAQLLFAADDRFLRPRNDSSNLQNELFVGLLNEGRKTPNDEQVTPKFDYECNYRGTGGQTAEI